MKPIRIAALVARRRRSLPSRESGAPTSPAALRAFRRNHGYRSRNRAERSRPRPGFSLGRPDGPAGARALAANSGRMRRVLAALFAAGVAKGSA